jgi:hypothetical protein
LAETRGFLLIMTKALQLFRNRGGSDAVQDQASGV